MRYNQSTCTGSMFSRWGSGSQTAPICHQPGPQRVDDAAGHDEMGLGVVVAERQIVEVIEHCRGDANEQREYEDCAY